MELEIVGAQEREAASAMENDSRASESAGCFGRPIQILIRKYAGGRKKMKVQEPLQWLLKQRQSLVEFPEKGTRRQSIEILAADWEANFQARERDLEERNREL